MNDQAVIDQFRDALVARGIVPPDCIVADGEFHRADVGTKNGKGDASYKLHLDGVPAGAICNWQDGLGYQTWSANIGRPFNEAEKRDLAAKMEVDRAYRQREEARKRAEAKAFAAQTLQSHSVPASDDHPYLRAKGIKAHRLRMMTRPFELAGVQCDGALVVPLMNADKEVAALQFITASGAKRYCGPTAGLYHSIGKPADDAPILVCEGIATGYSLRESTGHAVACALDTSNLRRVAELMREKFGAAKRLVVCADDDWRTKRPDGTPWNPGLEAAEAAALAVAGYVAVPRFPADRDDQHTDFNDMARLSGPDAVKRAVDEARKPVRPPGGPLPPVGPKGPAGARAVVRRFSDIEAKPIRWLWPGRIARGKVSMLAGNPGLGKSQLTASMAAVVTRGGRWPVDRTTCEAGSVVFLSAEDDPEDTIRPRLEGAGADLSKCVILEAIADGFDSSGGEIRRSFNLKSDLARLAEVLQQLGDVALVVIDPISAYLGGADSHNNAEIRALLAPLSEMAARHGAAIVGVSHLNKGGNSEALLRVTGSLAFVAAARGAFIVVADKDDHQRRLFLPLKNNIGKDVGGLAFSIESVSVPSERGEIESSRVSWEAAPVTITADEAMAASLDPEERSDLDDAIAFLKDMLLDGPIPSKRIQAESNGAGHSWATIRRAQKALKVEATKAGMKEGWVWRLPPQEPPKMLKTTEDAHTETVSTFGGNEHLPERQHDVEAM